MARRNGVSAVHGPLSDSTPPFLLPHGWLFHRVVAASTPLGYHFLEPNCQRYLLHVLESMRSLLLVSFERQDRRNFRGPPREARNELPLLIASRPWGLRSRIPMSVFDPIYRKSGRATGPRKATRYSPPIPYFVRPLVVVPFIFFKNLKIASDQLLVVRGVSHF